METNLILLIVVGTFVGAAAGYLGSFMVLKRMSLVGDALSHVALPGIALALSLNYSPMLGAFVALLIAVLVVWYFEETSNIYPEALVGVLFTASLALGILLTPQPDLLEALFGNIQKISPLEGLVAITVSGLIIFTTYLIGKKLILGIISGELAKSTGISGGKINLIYLLSVGTLVALGVKFVGTLLMGALVIVPAASAKNVSSSLRSYQLLSTIFGILATAGGALIANAYHTSSGPIIVLTSIGIFVLTYIAKRFIKLPTINEG